MGVLRALALGDLSTVLRASQCFGDPLLCRRQDTEDAVEGLPMRDCGNCEVEAEEEAPAAELSPPGSAAVAILTEAATAAAAAADAAAANEGPLCGTGDEPRTGMPEYSPFEGVRGLLVVATIAEL